MSVHCATGDRGKGTPPALNRLNNLLQNYFSDLHFPLKVAANVKLIRVPKKDPKKNPGQKDLNQRDPKDHQNLSQKDPKISNLNQMDPKDHQNLKNQRARHKELRIQREARMSIKEHHRYLLTITDTRGY